VADPAEHIREWQRAGLIDDETAARLLAYRRPVAGGQPVAEADRPGVIEILLYVGLVVAAAGVFFLVVQQWDELASWGRVALVAVPALLMLGAGAGMRLSSEPGVRRGGHVAWLLATALTAGALMAIFNEYVLDEGRGDERGAILTTATVTVVLAVVLWALAPSNPQVLALGGSVVFFAEALGAWPDDYTQRLAGSTIAIAGVVLLACTELGLFRPRPLARAVSAVLVGGGAYHAGIQSAIGWELLAFVAGAGLIAAGVWRQSFTFVSVGVVTFLVALVTFVFEHFEDRVGAPVALILAGGALVAAVLVLLQVRGLARSRKGTT
jgi:hypothetical protein